MNKRSDSNGRCYGSGSIGVNIKDGTADCVECGQRIGIHNKSKNGRLASHKPHPTTYRQPVTHWTRKPIIREVA